MQCACTATQGLFCDYHWPRRETDMAGSWLFRELGEDDVNCMNGDVGRMRLSPATPAPASTVP